MSIPIAKPYFGDEERAAVQEPIASGWIVQGPKVAEFEKKFAAFTGAAHAAAVSNCTTALHIAADILGCRPGDEVLVPAFTWVATANAVVYQGATPVFCDIDLATYNVDVAQLEAKITPRTAGIIAVHLFGLCADLDPILELARRRNLWVIEDAACAFGSWYRGRHAGTFGEIGCFSFHPRKSITTGEGGMITTARAEWDARARSLRDHGAARGAHASPLLPEFDRVGYNYRMTDIQAAVGCVQMDRAPFILEQRTRRARAYDAALADIRALRTPIVPDGYVHGYQAYVCLVAAEEPSMENVERLGALRNDVMRALDAKGIATRQGTHAAALTAYYRQAYRTRPEDFPNAYLAEQLSLALPLYPQMTDDEQSTVIEALRDALGSR